MIVIPIIGISSDKGATVNENVQADALLPLTPLTLQILVTLAGEPMHGYAVVKCVREATDGRINPGTGTFYSAIHRMSDEGLIEEVESPDASDSRRRTYAITEFGRDVLDAEVQRLDSVVELVRSARRS
jgi:DNA-binding PadR family transcriptional regulator